MEEEEENSDGIHEGNNDERYTKVDNDIFYNPIEGYNDENIEGNKGNEIEDNASQEKPKLLNISKKISHRFKVILLGEKGVGKSSIIDRYVKNKFSNFEQSNMRDAIQVKTFETDKDIVVELSINDTSEVENLGNNFPRAYFVDALGAMLVFNLTNPNSFQKLSYWKSELNSKGREDVVICYLGNQSDLTADIKVKSDEIKNFVGNNLYYQVSAKTGNNIALAFDSLTREIIKKQKEEEKNPNKVPIGAEGRKSLPLEPNKKQKKKKCC